jgi:Domain of unknown function (DUF4276)
MMNDTAAWSRPPIGLIVEGHGEYQSFPSVVSRIVDCNRLHIPRVNMRGCGSVLTNLAEHLSDLVKAHHPLTVLINTDLADFKQLNCSELAEEIRGKVTRWQESEALASGHAPLPKHVGVVIQIPKFESWLMADFISLENKGLVTLQDSDHGITDVDGEVSSPARWIAERSGGRLRSKRPRDANYMLVSSCIDTIAEKSKSFDKFKREIEKCYLMWQLETGQIGSR